MTTKEFLNRYLEADNQINAKLEQIHNLRALSTKTTQVLSADRVDGSVTSDKVAGIIAKIVDLEREIDADIDRLQDTKKRVEEVIARISDTKQRQVLTLRYINGKRWEEIALILNFNYRWILRLHGKALSKLAIESHC